MVDEYDVQHALLWPLYLFKGSYMRATVIAGSALAAGRASPPSSMYLAGYLGGALTSILWSMYARSDLE